MNMFEQIILDQINHDNAQIKLILLAGIAIIVLSAVCYMYVWPKVKTDKVDTSAMKRKLDSNVMTLIVVAITCMTLISLAIGSNSSTPYDAYESVTKVSGRNVLVAVDKKDVEIDLDSEDDNQRNLTDALSQVLGQRNFEKVVAIKQISDSQYEIFYRCTCGKVRSYISESY